MRKLTILATTAAVAINAISPAFATSLPSWSEVIAKAGTEGGGWVRGHHSNTVFKHLAGRDGFLFGNVLADDIPLPRVTDVTAVLHAAKQASKPIIVASNDWLLPSNPMLCEIAKQVKMECGDFTYNFYKYSQKDEEGNWSGLAESTAELEKVQAQVISYVESLGMTTESLNVKSEAVIALENVIASLETDLEANAITIEALNAQIAKLQENAELDADKIDDLNSQIEAKTAEIEKLGTTKSNLEKANEKLTDQKKDLQDKLDEAQMKIDALAKIRDDAKQALANAGIPQMEDLQSMINAIVDARDALQAQINVLPKEFATVQDIVTAWNAQKTAIANYQTALGKYATAAEAFQAGVNSVTTTVTEYPEGLEVANENHTVTISLQDGYVLVKNTEILNDQDANVANFDGITSTVDGNNVTLAVAEGYKLMTMEQYEQAIKDAKASVVANANTLDGLEVVTNGANVEISVKEGWTIVTKDTILNDQDATHNADTLDYISATVNGNEVTISVEEGYKVVENDYIPDGYKKVSDEQHVVSKTVQFTQDDIDAAANGLNAEQVNAILVSKEINFNINNEECTKQCKKAFGPGWSLGGGGVVTLYKKGGETQQIDIFPENGNGVNDFLAGEYNKKLAEGSSVSYDNGKVTVTFGALDSTEIHAVGEYVLTLPSNAAVESMLAKINLLTGDSGYDGPPQVPTDTKIQVHDYETNDTLYNVGSFSINHKIYNLTSIGAQAHLTGISDHEVETIKKIVEASYGKGYQDGYEDGYKQGWDDAIATAVNLPSN